MNMDNVDPLELIRQEKLSRQLHTPLAQANRSANANILEQFLVVGCSPLKSADNSPTVLFRYPDKTEHELQALEEFIFPTGIPEETKDESAKQSVLVYHEKNPHRSFVFMLTSDIKEIFYAICVIDDCLKTWPTFIPLPGDAPQLKSSYNRTRGYMIISRHPFFPLYFDILYSILGAEEVNQSFSKTESADQLFQQKNMALRILDTVLNSPVPRPGETISLPIGNVAPFTRPLVPAAEEDSVLLTPLCVPLLFFTLDLDQILFLMSAILQEKKILFIGSNVRLVTASLSAFIPLLRPYVLQCVIIPIVPDRLAQILQAPVPFIVGMANVPWVKSEMHQLTSAEIIVVNIDDRKVNVPPGMCVPPLPGLKQIQRALENPHKDLTRTFHSAIPYRPSDEQKKHSESIAHVLQQMFFAPFFKRFKHHCVTNLTDNVTVFLKESYLAEETTKETMAFFEAFLETQIFQIFCDGRLREIDNFKPRQRGHITITSAPVSPSMLDEEHELPSSSEAARGDIAWDPSSLLKPEDMMTTDDDHSNSSSSSVNSPRISTPASAPARPRVASTSAASPLSSSSNLSVPRLLVDRGRSVSSTGLSPRRTIQAANLNGVTGNATNGGAPASSPELASAVPFSPVRKPVIPPNALRKSGETSSGSPRSSSPAANGNGVLSPDRQQREAATKPK